MVLSIDDKLQLMDESVSYAVISEKYGVGRSTVNGIKKNREKLLTFKKDMIDMGMSRNAKTMRLGENLKLDKAVFLWFKQKRMEHIPVSGPMLCEKAVQLSSQLNGDEAKFVPSEGWKWRFCRHFQSAPHKLVSLARPMKK